MCDKNVDSKRYIISALLVLMSPHVIIASEGKKALSDGKEQMLEQWPYLYYEAQKSKQDPEEQQAAVYRHLEFDEALRSAAWQSGAKSSQEQKQLARSASSNALFETFKDDNGDRIYGVYSTLARRNRDSNVTKPLALEELVVLRDKIRDICCTPEWHGEQLKAVCLVGIQDSIRRFKAHGHTWPFA